MVCCFLIVVTWEHLWPSSRTVNALHCTYMAIFECAGARNKNLMTKQPAILIQLLYIEHSGSFINANFRTCRQSDVKKALILGLLGRIWALI